MGCIIVYESFHLAIAIAIPIAMSLTIGYSTHFGNSDGSIVGNEALLSLPLSGNRNSNSNATIAIAVWKRGINTWEWGVRTCLPQSRSTQSTISQGKNFIIDGGCGLWGYPTCTKLHLEDQTMNIRCLDMHWRI